MKVLVIPTNRPERLQDFFKAWQGRGDWDRVILVEDAPQRTIFGGLIDHAFSWKEIDEQLGKDAWIISRRDSAIRCFGFLVAWKMGADYVLTLDDDCFPVPERYIGGTLFDHHIVLMKNQIVWRSTVQGRTRGLPYKNFGRLETVANVGLWTGSGDPDAVCELAAGRAPDCILSEDSWIVPSNQLVPVCGMNLCIARRALPLFYFPLMGEGQPYRRFDDIWAGVIAKRCIDALGWNMSVGPPFVDHRRASDPIKNLVAEAPGIAANETFWQEFDEAVVRLPTTMSPRNLVQCIGYNLMKFETSKLAVGAGGHSYIAELGKALVIWSKLFEEKS